MFCAATAMFVEKIMFLMFVQEVSAQPKVVTLRARVAESLVKPVIYRYSSTPFVLDSNIRLRVKWLRPS